MQLIGRKGGYVFYRHKGYLKFLDHLPVIRPSDIIAGGAPVALLLAKGKALKDIDVWSSEDIPVEANRESEYAWNYQKDHRSTPVQYIKIKAHKPSALLDTFDLDAAKCAFYNITPEGYDVCIHNYLKPIVYGKPPQGVCGVNPKAFNEFTLGRLSKYAHRFARGTDMFSPEDYALAVLHLDILAQVPQSYLIRAVTEYYESNATGEAYALLDHLQGLFGNRRGLVGLRAMASSAGVTGPVGGLVSGDIFGDRNIRGPSGNRPIQTFNQEYRQEFITPPDNYYATTVGSIGTTVREDVGFMPSTLGYRQDWPITTNYYASADGSTGVAPDRSVGMIQTRGV